MADAIDKDSVIRVNPEAKGRREGTKVAAIFACYKDGMTVAEFLEAAKEVGGGMSNLRTDIARGNVTLEEAA